MNVVIKYSGYGITSRGINFDEEKNDGLYTVSQEDADYLVKTFPNNFVLIERVSTPVAEKKEEVKPAPKRRTRKKKDSE